IRSADRVRATHCGHRHRRDAGRPPPTTDRQYRRGVVMFARLRFAQHAVSPSRARCVLLFLRPAVSWLWYSRESDDVATRSQIASTASAGLCRRTRNVLSGLVSDEFVEIGVSEPDAPALPAVADVDIVQRARSDVAVERLDRAVQLGGGLRGGLEPVQ